VVNIRRLSLLTLIIFAVWLSYGGNGHFTEGIPGIFMAVVALASTLLCFLLIKKGISQIYIIYGVFVIFLLIISGRELFN